jgi:hypothetical protein
MRGYDRNEPGGAGYVFLQSQRGITVRESEETDRFIQRMLQKHIPRAWGAWGSLMKRALKTVAEDYFGIVKASPQKIAESLEIINQPDNPRVLYVMHYRAHWWHYNRPWPSKMMETMSWAGLGRIKLPSDHKEAHAKGSNDGRVWIQYREMVAIMSVKITHFRTASLVCTALFKP